MSDAPILSTYSLTVPALLRTLETLLKILKKAEIHAEAKGIKTVAILNAQLALDMFPLKGQIQAVSDTAKGAAARLAGVEAPSFPDTEETFAELYERLNKTIDFIKSVPVSAFEGAETKEVIVKTPKRDFHFTGFSYLTGFVLPNLYFHTSMAYAILRSNGVELGKMDYLGQT
jgi:uncharacterized protein